MKKNLARIAGVLLAVAAGVCFAIYARRAFVGHDLSGLASPRVITVQVALTLLYAATILTTAAAWTGLMRAFGQPLTFKTLLVILATTQFGKYLPGNVAHQIGRIELARRRGAAIGPVVLSVVYELLLALVASAHVAALALFWAPPPALAAWPLFQHRALLLTGVTLGAGIVLLRLPQVAAWVANRRSRGEGPPKPMQAPRLATLLGCYGWYASSFVMIGAGLWLLSRALGAGNPGIGGFVFFLGAFASSWILGFIAPGAPAGLGIREFVLGTWLSMAMPATDAVLMVIALRIATTLGDLVNFLWGGWRLWREGGHPLAPRAPQAPSRTDS